MTKAARFEIYQERDDRGNPTGQWRWRFINRNGKNTANGSEGYDNRSNAKRAVKSHIKMVGIADTVVVEA